MPRRATKNTYAIEHLGDGIDVRRLVVAGQDVPDHFELEDEGAVEDKEVPVALASYSEGQIADRTITLDEPEQLDEDINTPHEGVYKPGPADNIVEPEGEPDIPRLRSKVSKAKSSKDTEDKAKVVEDAEDAEPDEGEKPSSHVTRRSRSNK
jgi:hypothetical protein